MPGENADDPQVLNDEFYVYRVSLMGCYYFCSWGLRCSALIESSSTSSAYLTLPHDGPTAFSLATPHLGRQSKHEHRNGTDKAFT